MSKYSGHGGYAVFAVTVDAVTSYYLIDNVSHEPSHQTKMNEYTDSASGGVAQGLGRVTKTMCNLDVNDDDEAALDLAGIPTGTTGDLYVKRGELVAFDLFEGCTYASYARTNENESGPVPRVRLSFEFGTPTVWLDEGDLPSGLVTYLQGLDPARL